MAEKKAHSADLSSLRIDRDVGSKPNKVSKSRGRVAAIVTFSLLALFAVYFWIVRGEAGTAMQVWTVTKVFPTQADAILTATGYVVAQRQAAIASKGTGQLEYLGVEEGDVVKEGQVIAQLEHSDVDAALEQAKANLAVARASLQERQANLREAELNFQRQKDLFERKLIAESEFDISEARFRSAEAAVAGATAQIELAEAALVAAQVDVENTRIRAPFDGTVLSKNADIGEMVAPFAASSNSRGAVVTVADMSSLEVEADVSESSIQRVQAGQPCEIVLDAFPDERYPAFVHKIVPTADRAKATVLTKIRFKQADAKVLPEMSAKVRFLASGVETEGANSQPFTGVPKSAILRRNGKDVVFLVRSQIITESPISTGRQIGGQVEVLAGLSEGDQVVLRPTEELQSGAKIRIQ